ncbi:MAG: lamin tail domain-containing protein [Cytophagaceae bacterium]|nr:lamin tail domain-containing protein [Cytophagaceae bacterium]
MISYVYFYLGKRNFRFFFVCISIFFLLSAENFLKAQDQVDFSHKRGFYNASFQLTLTSGIAGATIRYTTNGTAPTTSTGTIYSSPITISGTSNIRAIAYSGTIVSKVYTHSYIFPDEVIHQPATIPGWPNNTYSTGQGTAVHDYEMDPDIVNSPVYSGAIKNSLLAIPTMSIVMDKNQFWASNDAPNEQDIESPASVEVIYPNDPTKSEQVNCGLEGHSWNRLKRSFRLKFKASYGDPKFNTQLLKQGPVNGNTVITSLDGLVLRAGNNRSWARSWNPNRTCYTRDEWYRESQVEISGTGSHGSFVHLYINGLYWGLYNPIERPDTKFSAAYLGGADTDWFALNHDGPKDGDPARYNYLVNTLVNKDMTIAANYNELQEYLDVEDFCDYMIVTWMTGMTDWPQNNFWGGNRNNPATPFHYYAWDGEWSWDVTNGSNNGAWVHPNFRKSQSGGVIIASLWHAARKNPGFMMLFADRVQKHCFNNGPLTDINSRARWAAINNFIKDAIIAESARWGDALNDGVTRTKNDHWQPEINRLDGLMNGNVARFLTALRTEGYFPSINVPVFNSSGGEVNAGFQLVITNPNAAGTIYYTLNGSDPRAADGNIAAAAIAYSSPVNINNSVAVKARIKNGTEWSAITEVSFVVKNTGLITGLFINEFLASNSLTNTDEFGDKDDWVEIYNSTNNPINIGGLYITDILTNKTLYKIPTTDAAATTIPAKGYKLLWADGEPAEGVLHVMPKLSNGGEQIGLFQIVGSDTFALDQLTFGAQITDVSSGRYLDGAANFISFNKPTPAAKNTVNSISTLFINEFVASNVNGITDEFGDHEDWIEIYNAGDLAVDIGGLYITDNLSNPGSYQIPTTNPSLTTIAAKGFLLLWADGETTEGVLHVTPKLSTGGEQIGLFQKFGTEYIVIDSLTFKAQSADVSTGRYPDASVNQTLFAAPTPTANNILPLRTGLFINEFLAGNTNNITDEFGDHDDWIEIYNSTNNAIDIGGLFISDNLANPLQYQISTSDPAKTIIPAHGFILLWADKQMPQGKLHVDIKLSGGGEAIALVQKNGNSITFLDSLTFTAQTDDISEGRYPNGTSTFKKFTSPTPNASNVITNAVPVVSAGPSKSVSLPQDTISLFGTASDPDGDPLTFLWKKESGPACLIEDSTHLSLKIKNLAAGIYIFRLTAKDNQGGIASDTAKVMVINPSGPGVISFTLVNADTDQDIRTLKLQDTINLGALPTNKINIRANTNPTVTGSVIFILNGSSKTENTAPYSLKGDNSGDYTAWTPALDNYNLKATSFSLASGKGAAGNSLTINFVVMNNTSNQLPTANAGPDKNIALPLDSIILNGSASDPDGNITSYTWTKTSGGNATMSGDLTPNLKVKNLQQGSYKFRLTVKDNNNATAFDEVNVNVTAGSNSGQTLVSFTLVNADTDTDIRVINNSDQINLAELPTNKINIKANTNPATVGSVVFILNGKKTNENTAPYSLKGDDNGNYKPWTPAPGDYSLTGTPYTLTNGSGAAGTTLTINFKVVNNLGAAMRQEDSVSFMQSTPEIVEMNAYPNPFSESVNIEFTTSVTQYITLEIYDEKGNLEQVLYEGIANAKDKYVFQFDGRKVKEGVYYSRLVTRNLVRNQRLLLIK